MTDLPKLPVGAVPNFLTTETGWSTECPKTIGLFEFCCAEGDYGRETVELYGPALIGDFDLGRFPAQYYHDRLTDCRWREVARLNASPPERDLPMLVKMKCPSCGEQTDVTGQTEPRCGNCQAAYGDHIVGADEMVGTQDNASLLALIAEIRQAAGDPHGKLMQPDLVAHIANMRAELDGARKALEATERIRIGKYLEWASAGGPNECKHGRADGIPCPYCDADLVVSALPPAPSSEQEPVTESKL